MPVPSQDRSQTTARINTRSPKIAAFVHKIENRQQTMNEPSIESSSSYHDKIKKILTKWQQLQNEKKLYQQQQEQQKQDEFDRIMEENLENQLKELERQEEDQYKLIEQLIEEQLEHEYQTNPTDNLEEEYNKQLKQFQELETIIDKEEQEEKKQNNRQLKKFQTWKHHEQHYHLEQFKKYQQQQQSKKAMNLDIWKQKHRKKHNKY